MKLDTLKANAPIILYALFYTVFSLIGITLFYAQNEFYLLVYEVSSGVARPVLSSFEQYSNLFFITYIVPAVFIAGFYLAYKKISTSFFSRIMDEYLDINKSICLALYVLVASIIMYRILSFVDFTDIAYAYTNYNVMIATRYVLFDHLTRWDWILIYSAIPTLTGILIYQLHSQWAKIAIIATSSFILLYTMQKRYILLMLIFVYFIGIIRDKLPPKKLMLRTLSYLTVLVGIFVMQTFLPVSYLFSAENFQTNTMQQIKVVSPVAQVSANTGKKLSIDKLKVMYKTVGSTFSSSSESEMPLIHKIETKALYFFNAFLNRTSVPMVYFFELFPYKKDYLGNWQSCFIPHYNNGVAEYEGNVVWSYTNGDTPGCLAAPYNFSLYSRVGVWGALVISLIYGLALGVCWAVIRKLNNRLSYAVLTPMLYILMIFLSMDSFISSVFTAYGLFWWVFTFIIVGIASALALASAERFK